MNFDLTTLFFLSDFKIWHQASKSDQGVLAAEAGAKILDFFGRFYDVEYPLPKMDMAGVFKMQSFRYFD
jgi:hypothetical protein